jgi:hypothetical protein
MGRYSSEIGVGSRRENIIASLVGYSAHWQLRTLLSFRDRVDVDSYHWMLLPERCRVKVDACAILYGRGMTLGWAVWVALPVRCLLRFFQPEPKAQQTMHGSSPHSQTNPFPNTSLFSP